MRFGFCRSSGQRTGQLLGLPHGGRCRWSGDDNWTDDVIAGAQCVAARGNAGLHNRCERVCACMST